MEQIDRRLVAFQEKRDPAEFLHFLRQNVSIDYLLPRRKAQATLARYMSLHFTRDKRFQQVAVNSGVTMIINPYPVIILNDPRRGGEHIHTAFLLQDQEHFYFFPTWNPGDPVPPYLRPQDVVASETYSRIYPSQVKKRIMEELRINEETFRRLVYEDDLRVTSRGVLHDIPFNKPFCKVPVMGGEAMLFNYNQSVWEPSGQGVYTPDGKTKMSLLLRAVGKKFYGSVIPLAKNKRLPPRT